MSAQQPHVHSDTLEQRLSVATLPTLLPSASYLINALSEPTLGVDQLPEVLETSPVIAARILALANSAWSAPSTPISSLDRACQRLGLNLIRAVGVAIAVAEPFRPSQVEGFDPIRFWSSSLLAADASLWLSERLNPDDQQTARTAALLARLGLLWLVEHYPQETAQAIALRQQGHGESLNNALNQCCGMGHVEVSQHLALHWRLPTVLCEAIGRQKDHQLNPDLEPITVMVASATRMCFSLSHQLEFEPDERWLPLLRVDREVQLDAFEKLKNAANDKRHIAEAIAGK